jgi:hypothetical protein
MKNLEIHRAPTKGGRRTDTVVYAPYAWAANGSNTAGRYEAIAEGSGFDVVVGHVPGAGQAIIDKATRRSLQLSTLGEVQKLTAAHAEAVTKAIGSYATRIGLGDSGRGVWVSAMQLREAHPFTHVLTRDGFNLDEQRLLGGLIRAIRFGSSTGETIPDFIIRPPGQRFTESLHNGACALSEAWNWHWILGSTVGVEAARKLAGDGSTPFHNVALGYGIGGSAKQAVAFNQELGSIRQAAIEPGGPGTTTQFVGTFEAGWGHGNLCDPRGAVIHLQQTAALAVG